MMMDKETGQQLSILLVGTQMATGGAQKVLLDQARWFHQHGYKVFAVFIYDKEGLQARWQTASDFPVIDLKAFRKDGKGITNGILLARGLFSLWGLLRREKIDVIETFTHDGNLFALPVAWLARVPVRIATHHGVIEGFPRWLKRLHAWMVNHNIAHKLVTVSEKTGQIALVEGVKAGRISVIQNGTTPLLIEGVNRLEICTEQRQSVRKEAGIGADDPFLLSVGRLCYQKAHEVLVSAMPVVLQEFPNAKVGICGEGVLRKNLETQINSFGLDDSVKLFGIQNNIQKFLASADIFVLPSRWEGLPVALLEAMSAGLPVIATKVEGVDEVIVDGVHGLFAPLDDADALSQVILQLLRDGPMRTRMGNAAKQRVIAMYSVDRMCERYLSLIHMLYKKRI